MEAKEMGSVERPGKPKVVKPPPPESRLRRDTRFIANMSFRADLPELVSDPKLLASPWRPSELARFSVTAVESQPRRDLLVARNFSLPLNTISCRQYDAREKGGLDPEDKQLMLEDGEDLVVDPTTRQTMRQQGAGSELSWLMRTTYISNELPLHIHQSMEKPVTPKPTAEAEAYSTREGQLDLIEKSFAARKRPAVHPKNPGLRPVEEWDVFPDFENWPLNFVAASFDNDPTEDSQKLKHLELKYRDQIADRALLKSFDIATETEKGRARGLGEEIPTSSFLAFIAPCDLQPEDPTTGRNKDMVGEGDYIWVKEYAYHVKHKDVDEKPTFMFKFANGAVNYVDISTRLVVKKRRTGVSVSRPSKVVLKTRELTAAEKRMRKRRRNELYGEIEGQDEEVSDAEVDADLYQEDEFNDINEGRHSRRAISPDDSD